MQPRQSYLVSATPRSGSTLFCELLRQTGVAGHPKEYFEMLNETGLPRQPQQFFEASDQEEILDILKRPTLCTNPAWLAQWSGANYPHYLQKVLEEGTTPNGVFGAKMMWNYFDHFLSNLRQSYGKTPQSIHHQLTEIFPDLQYIWVTRQSKERQVVSLWKAIQTQRWRQETDETSDAKENLIFHFGALSHLEQQIRADEAAWQQYFHEYHLHPLVIVYEDLIAAKEQTIRQTLQYLGIPTPDELNFASLPMKAQADTLSEEWVQRYQQLKQEHSGKSQEYVA